MVTYNKIYEKKDGRKLVASGPRNSQKRQTTSLQQTTSFDEIDQLRKEIKTLTSGFVNNTSAYTKEQLDGAVNTAIEEVALDLEKKYVVEIEQLKVTNEKLNLVIDKLNIKLDKKDDVILELTTKLSTGSTIIIPNEVSKIVEDDRPSIDSVFIDPIKNGAEDKLESHVITKETKSLKSDVALNVNKLKKLMGKLPK